MADLDLSCPICQAHVPVAGDEKPGDEVYCTYCGAPCRITGKDGDEDGWELEEDF
jgi:hypothetical protein